MSMAGWEGNLRVATTDAGLAGASNVAGVRSARTGHAGGLRGLYAHGSRKPGEVKEGNIDVTLAIEKEYRDNVFAGYANVGGDTANTEYFVGIYPQGYAAGRPKIVAQGKFGNWRIDGPQGDIAVESLDFVGKALSVGTI